LPNSVAKKIRRAEPPPFQLRQVANKLKTKIALGGEAFRHSDMRVRFPADFFPNDFPALLRIAARLKKGTED
jgi:hypothetical protein